MIRSSEEQTGSETLRRGRRTALTTASGTIRVATGGGLQFVDLTDRVGRWVRRTGIRRGWVNVQSTHTTAAILLNENEPLLLEDLARTIEAIAPRESDYRHDDFTVRTTNLTPDERRNGHSHCKAMLLKASETLNIVAGRLDLGRWQRLFLVELDGAQRRRVSVVALGA
jgi:secondary thiamine-phosphate synthase enzyme